VHSLDHKYLAIYHPLGAIWTQPGKIARTSQKGLRGSSWQSREFVWAKLQRYFLNTLYRDANQEHGGDHDDDEDDDGGCCVAAFSAPNAVQARKKLPTLIYTKRTIR